MRMSKLERLEQSADDLTGVVDDLHDMIITLRHTPISDDDLLDMVKQTYEAVSEKLQLVLAERDIQLKIREKEELAYQKYEYQRSVS